MLSKTISRNLFFMPYATEKRSQRKLQTFRKDYRYKPPIIERLWRTDEEKTWFRTKEGKERAEQKATNR